MKVALFEEGKKKYKTFQDLVKDLNLHVIMNYMVAERKEDIAWISEVLSVPLETKEAIGKRNEIVKFFCENPVLAKEGYELIRNHYEHYKRLLEVIETSKNSHEKSAILIASSIDIMKCLGEFFQKLTSWMEDNSMEKVPQMKLLWESFYEEVTREQIQEIVTFTKNMDAFKRDGAMTLELGIGREFQVSNIRFVGSKSISYKRRYDLPWQKKRGVRAYKEEKNCAEGMEFGNAVIVQFVRENINVFRLWEEQLRRLRRQSAFLMGCVTLYHRGKERDFYYCYPELSGNQCQTEELYELSLAFQTTTFPVVNSVSLTEKQILVITGANQGGKSTFLRSLGIAQVMYQAGMFIPAKMYSSKIYHQIFSHFTRREDAAMNTGRFEEELKRMEYILQNVQGSSLILSNETFCGTTEVTAAKVAMAIALGIEGHSIELWMVTHISKFAIELWEKGDEKHLFLSAAHDRTGERRFKMEQKPPENTSFGMELFEQIIEEKSSPEPL